MTCCTGGCSAMAKLPPGRVCPLISTIAFCAAPNCSWAIVLCGAAAERVTTTVTWSVPFGPRWLVTPTGGRGAHEGRGVGVSVDDGVGVTVGVLVGWAMVAGFGGSAPS